MKPPARSSAFLYGLIGFPVSHSLSAVMHNAAFRALGIPATYELFEVAPEKLEEFFTKTIKENNILGFNVTIPHKERSLSFIEKIPELVALIGAANTVKVDNGKLSCTNTDAEGFMRHLAELPFSPSGKRIALLGAGGAAKAVSVQLAMAHPAQILIYDSDKRKAEELVSRLQGHFSLKVSAVISVENLDVHNVDLLVNATPVGMKPNDPCLVPEKEFHKGLLVYDLIYNPQKTALLKLAEAKGAQIANGLKMLLYQGIGSFRFWTGKEPPQDVMEKALLEHLTKKG